MTIVMVIPDPDLPCDARQIPGNYHFEGRCDYCDAVSLSHKTLGQVENLYNTGRCSQYQYEAYCHVFALLSPTGSLSECRTRPWDPQVRAFARRLLRLRDFDVPDSLGELQEAGDPR